jgi:hypothetical protein
MVDDSGLLWDQVPIEHKQPVDVVLCLQMALKRYSHKADATNFTFNPPTLRGCCVPSLLCGILLLRFGNPYLPRQTRHDFRLSRIRLKANSFEKVYENCEG